jgi:hypothetical protein
MALLRPVPAARQASPATFVHSDLEKCTHSFLRQDTTRRVLELSYGGPYKVMFRRERRQWTSSCSGGPSLCQSTGWRRPTSSICLTAETTHQPDSRRNPSRSTICHTNLKLRPPHSFPCSFQHLINDLHGGDVGTSDKSNRQLPQGSRSTRYLYITACHLLSGHPHKGYPINPYNCSSIANWFVRRPTAGV